MATALYTSSQVRSTTDQLVQGQRLFTKRHLALLLSLVEARVVDKKDVQQRQFYRRIESHTALSYFSNSFFASYVLAACCLSTFDPVASPINAVAFH